MFCKLKILTMNLKALRSHWALLFSITLYAFTFFSCSSFNNKKLHIKEVAKAANGKFYYDGKLFNGVLFDIFSNNEKKVEFKVKNGLYDGSYIEWNDKGDTIVIGNYSNGKKNGHFETRQLTQKFSYESDINTIVFDENYVNGILNGPYKSRTTKSNGFWIEEVKGNYKNGNKVGVWEHRLNNELIFLERNQQVEELKNAKAVVDSGSVQNLTSINTFVFGQNNSTSGGWYKLLVDNRYSSGQNIPIRIEYYYDDKLYSQEEGYLYRGAIDINGIVGPQPKYRFSNENEFCAENSENGLYDCYSYIIRLSNGDPTSYFYKVKLTENRYLQKF